jgi:hypothetical protein
MLAQLDLLLTTAVAPDVPDPGPGDRHGTTTIGQRDHQQLVCKTNLGAVHDQTDLAHVLVLILQPGFGDRFVPAADINCFIGQKPAEASYGAHILGCTQHFACDPTQTDGTTMKDTNHQPDKVLHLCDPLLRAQFTNSLNPSTIGLVDRHGILLAKSFVVKQLYLIFPADQYSFVKVSGS